MDFVHTSQAPSSCSARKGRSDPVANVRPVEIPTVSAFMSLEMTQNSPLKGEQTPRGSVNV